MLRARRAAGAPPLLLLAVLLLAPPEHHHPRLAGAVDVEVDADGKTGGAALSYCTPAHPCDWDATRASVRDNLLYDRGVPPSAPFPHVHVSELYAPENEPFLNRRRAFVLTGAMEDWEAPEQWKDGVKIAEMFPRSVVDFYPMNMLKGGSHPYLFYMKQALNELNQAPGHGRFGGQELETDTPGKYLHLQLVEDMWSRLREDKAMGDPIHKWMRTDGWMKRCIKKKSLRDEYHIKTHWKIILIGGPGAGMFNHSDSLLTSSWHAHVQGDAGKWWYVCGKGVGEGPYKGVEKCHEDLIKPGEVLFYPKSYYHETQNLAMPTMTVTGTVVSGFNYRSIATQLHRECAFQHLSFDLSGPLCDALDKCYVLWHQALSGNKDKKAARKEARRLWPRWRSLAGRDIIQKKDRRDALGNNYDGRNFINK